MISILTTHYNRPDALIACLKAINNVHLNFPYEIVVSDDGSRKDTIDILKKLEIDTLVLANANGGLAANLNKGIKACRGDYILYVQEDFLMIPEFKNVLQEGIELLDKHVLDMVRYRSNYKFEDLEAYSEHVFKIPKFSYRNFFINTFQYSDHPFLTTPSFYDTFGYYLENTSVGYGETEYAIRILKSKARIGITKQNYFKNVEGARSTVYDTVMPKRRGMKKALWRFARALRQHLEWLLYNPNQRKLYTYKNKRI